MLTKSDLSSIQKIIREEVGNEAKATKDELRSDILTTRVRVQSDIMDLKDRIKNLEIGTTRMHQDLKEEIKMAVNFLDRENVKTTKRVRRIEDHLGLTTP